MASWGLRRANQAFVAFRRNKGIFQRAIKLNVPDVDLTAFESTCQHSRSKKYEPRSISRETMAKIESIVKNIDQKETDHAVAQTMGC